MPVAALISKLVPSRQCVRLHQPGRSSHKVPVVEGSAGRQKMDRHELSGDETENKEYLFVSRADRSYTGKVRAHVLCRHIRIGQRRERHVKLHGSIAKPFGISENGPSIEISASQPASKFADSAQCRR